MNNQSFIKNIFNHFINNEVYFFNYLILKKKKKLILMVLINKIIQILYFYKDNA